MHGMGVVLALNEQCVRLYCLNLTRVIGDRCSMRSQSHFHALFKYIMYNNNGSALIFIRWLNVWNGCRVGVGRSARTCVLLRVCVLELGGVVDGDRHSMHEVVISPSHTL